MSDDPLDTIRLRVAASTRQYAVDEAYAAAARWFDEAPACLKVEAVSTPQGDSTSFSFPMVFEASVSHAFASRTAGFRRCSRCGVDSV